MAFLGNPGTGKTMVARVLGNFLHMVGILPTDKVTEVHRTDLVGEFVGHTGPKTRRKIKEAEGGILFVDEANCLIPMQKSDDKDYGIEALEEIMFVMDGGLGLKIKNVGMCYPSILYPKILHKTCLFIVKPSIMVLGGQTLKGTNCIGAIYQRSFATKQSFSTDKDMNDKY